MMTGKAMVHAIETSGICGRAQSLVFFASHRTFFPFPYFLVILDARQRTAAEPRTDNS